VSIDEGEVDMFGVMKEVVRNKYTGVIYPEHARLHDYDREYFKLLNQPLRGYPGGGYTGTAFCVACTRAMLQAALVSA
jgi:mannonate dehydratase